MSIAVFSGKNYGGVFWQTYFWGHMGPKTILSYCKGIVFGWRYELKCEEKTSLLLLGQILFFVLITLR